MTVRAVVRNPNNPFYCDPHDMAAATNPSATTAIGAVQALTGDSIKLGITVATTAANQHRHISFITNAHVLSFIGTSTTAAITDISIWCNATCIASVIPDAWGQPAAGVTMADGISKCHYIANTNVYAPAADLEMPPFITPQIKPNVLVGSPPSVLFFAPTDGTVVTVKFTLWRHGVTPSVPWVNP